jgi:hypothetical protein
MSRCGRCALWTRHREQTRRFDDESIARHRADAARKKTDRDPARKWAHLAELARQREVEAAGRAAVADLYEE